METTSISKYKCPECGSKIIVRHFYYGSVEYECINDNCLDVDLFPDIDTLNDYLKQNQRRTK